MLSVNPVPFKPTLVSDYFFDEDGASPCASSSPSPSPSPTAQRRRYEVAVEVDEAGPITEDEVDADDDWSYYRPYHGPDGSGVVADPKSAAAAAATILLPPPQPHDALIPMTTIDAPTPTQTHEAPAGPVREEMKPDEPIRSNMGSPSQVPPAEPAARGPSDSPPTSHCMRMHQELLVAAAMPSACQLPVCHPPPPMAPVPERKYSTGMTSAPSTAPTSTVTSPFSPADSESTTHTPSPPLLTLPQAVVTNSPAAGAASVIFTTPQQSYHTPITTPSTTPARYRTVPAAASHIPPVVVPPHADLLGPRTAYRPPPPQPQHAQTPRQTHHGHAASAVTPPTSSRAPSASLIASSPRDGQEYVGPFILGPVLGRGCTGTVRLGTHKRNKFEVAFKIIEKRYLQSDPKLWAKVKREIVILKLIEHKNVLKLYDVLETENRLYLVLEHVKGGELFDYIVAKGRLDRQESLRIAAQIAMGLEHCHKHQICHRDLKPENLLLDEHANVKIADWGMAQLMKPDGVLKTSCGSPHYASPEVTHTDIIEGSTYDAKRTDVWSLGVILYALITGSLPFDHDNIPTLLTMVTKGHYTTPVHVPADIAHLISRMLTVDPSKRITLPEIRHHACFKGTNYFEDDLSGASVQEMTNRLAMHMQQQQQMKSAANTPIASPVHTHATHKKHKPNTAVTPIRGDDSDDEDLVHTWRKTSRVSPPSFASYEPHPDAKIASPPHHFTYGGSGSAASPLSIDVLEEDVIDESVLNDLESLGLGARNGNREELKQKVRGIDTSREPSLDQVFYRLLRQRKLARLRELEMLSPKVTPMQTMQTKRRHHRHHLESARQYSSSRGSESQPASAARRSSPEWAMVASAPASRIASAVNSPSSRYPELAFGLQDLQLPPPHPRASPTQNGGNDDAMVDVRSDAPVSKRPRAGSDVTASGAGSSLYSATAAGSSSSAPHVSHGTAPSPPAQASIFSGINAAREFAANLFERLSDKMTANAE